MENLKKLYNSLKRHGLKKQAVYAHQYFKDKYYGDGYLLETKLNPSTGTLRNGKIYMYDYDPITKDRLAYYDTKPMVFVIDTYLAEGTGNVITRGINLHFLPREVRLSILNAYAQYFESHIKKEEEMLAKGQVYKRSPKNMKAFMNYLSTGISKGIYSFAFRSYITDRIKDRKIIEYNDWKNIPFIDPKDFIGITPAQAYKLYKGTSKKKK